MVALAAAGVNDVVQSAVSEENAGIKVGAEDPTNAPACTPNVAFWFNNPLLAITPEKSIAVT